MARYLLALDKIRGGQAHEARNQLGGVTIQLDLIGELLKRGDQADAMRPRIEEAAARASRAARAVLPVLQRLVDQTERLGPTPASIDLHDVLRRVEGLIVPFLRREGKDWKLLLPETPLAWEGDRDVLRDTLLVVAVEAGNLVPKGGCLEFRLEADGTLSVSGAATGDWVNFLRETMGADVVETTQGQALQVQVRLAVQPAVGGN